MALKKHGCQFKIVPIAISKFVKMKIRKLIDIVNNYYSKDLEISNSDSDRQNNTTEIKRKCQDALRDQSRWKKFLNEIKEKSSIEVTEFILLQEFNPSFIAVFLTEEYTRPKPKDYQPLQLVLKLSVLAPVYSTYFDNLVSETNKRLIRINPVTEKEKIIIDYIHEGLKNHYMDHSIFDFSMSFYALHHLPDISTSNKRKPYLDECIFGRYLSIHPYNILEDKLNI